jgi:hypothetical protein
MQKLTLDVDGLCVESFATARVPEPRGTVHGQATQAPTCVKTCAATCHCTSVDIGCWCTEAC